MQYLVTGMIVVVVGAIVLGVLHARHENSPGTRPSLAAARRAMRQPQALASGQPCVCGGTLRETGEVSGRFGTLLGCTGCRRSWAENGRQIRRRRPAGARRGAPPPS